MVGVAPMLDGSPRAAKRYRLSHVLNRLMVLMRRSEGICALYAPSGESSGFGEHLVDGSETLRAE
jgi:hypothetical protein